MMAETPLVEVLSRASTKSSARNLCGGRQSERKAESTKKHAPMVRSMIYDN